jgi:hydrogenase maturation factor HypF (carbamoyltransferase family)
MKGQCQSNGIIVNPRIANAERIKRRRYSGGSQISAVKKLTVSGGTGVNRAVQKTITTNKKQCTLDYFWHNRNDDDKL